MISLRAYFQAFTLFLLNLFLGSLKSINTIASTWEHTYPDHPCMSGAHKKLSFYLNTYPSLTVCYCHVSYVFQSEFILYSCLDVKKTGAISEV